MAAGAELLGGPTGAGSGGNRRWHGGAAGGVGFSGQRVLHLQGADPAAANRGGERQLPARPPAAQTDAGTRSRRGGAYRDPSGHHPGGAANLAGGRARGVVEQRGDVVGGRPPPAVNLKRNCSPPSWTTRSAQRHYRSWRQARTSFQ